MYHKINMVFNALTYIRQERLNHILLKKLDVHENREPAK